MANATTPQTTARQTESFDRKDLSRLFSRLRHEVGGLVDDANRSRPFYAKSPEEAVAKRDAALKVIGELADRIDVLKKD